MCLLVKKMKNTTQTELHEFVLQQAADDAALPLGDRRHQAEVVADVLGQELLQPDIRKGLLDDYIDNIASLRANKPLATETS